MRKKINFYEFGNFLTLRNVRLAQIREIRVYIFSVLFFEEKDGVIGHRDGGHSKAFIKKRVKSGANSINAERKSSCTRLRL